MAGGAVLGHVLTGAGRAAGITLWVGQIAMWAGLALCFVVFERRIWRALAGGAAVAGLTATVVAMAMAPPAPPQYDLSLGRAAATVLRQPAIVQLCALYGDGSITDLPATQDIIDVRADGTLVLETTNPVVQLSLTPGVHTLAFELLAPDHRAFGKAVQLAATVVVAPVPQGPAATLSDSCQ